MKSRRVAARRSGYAAAALLAALLLMGAQSWLAAEAHAATKASTPGRMFWVQSTAGWTHFRYDLLVTGAHLQIFGRSNDHVSRSAAVAVAETFERRIYPTDTRVFGLPRHLAPVDIVFAALDSVTLGYFDQNDVNPLAVGADSVHSNRADVFYVRAPATMPDANKLADTDEVVAHELQHLIEYRVRVLERRSTPEDDWLNEGLSFYAQIANGYWTPRDVLKVDAAASQPGWPVNGLNQGVGFLRRNARVAYGRAGLFTTYLTTRFGAPIVRSLIDSQDVGLSAVDDAIRARSHRSDLASVFGDWAVAQYLGAPGQYGYGALTRQLRVAPSLAVPPVSSYPYDSSRNVARPQMLQPWGQEFVRFDARGDRDLLIRIDAPGAHLRVAAVLQDSTGVVPTKVSWISCRYGHPATYRLTDFGSLYDRATLAISYAGSPAGGDVTANVRVRASLVDVSHDYRASRLAAPARGDLDFFIRKIPQLHQLLALR